MMSTKDYYKTLGIERNASDDDVKKAYRKLVRKYHPDTNKDETAEAKMSEINEAYTVISNKEKRTSYDQFGTAPPPGAGGFPGGGFNNVNFTDDFGSVADIFDSMFGGGRRRTKNRNVVYEGADIKVQVIMTLEEAHSGKKITVDIPRFDKCPECAGTGTKDGSKPKTCPDCRGTGQVTRAQQTVFGTFQTATTCPRCRGEGTIIDNPCPKCHGQTVVRNHHKIEVDIPAGIEDGMRVRVRAEGDAGKKGGPSGDLFVLVRIKPHKVFKRHGIDLTSNVSISMYEAALGKEITVFTITGKDKIKVKPGTQPDDTLILRGKGMPRLSGRSTGDLHITFKIVIPKKMTKAEKSALKKFL